MQYEPLETLIVEDNPGDVRLILEALKEGKLLLNISVVQDGIEAMDFLRRQGKYQQAPRPDLIILDLNLPKKSGREVLAEVKTDDDLRIIPVVVLTSSEAQDDVARAYGLHVNCYVAKPLGLDEFMRVIKSIDEFWLRTVRLPGGTKGAESRKNW